VNVALRKSMNIKYLLKKVTDSILTPFGLEIRRKLNLENTIRISMQGALTHLKEIGFYPKTVIDVGVANGTMSLYETFPLSKHILIEPLQEFKPNLEELIKRFPNSEYIIAAATQKSGNITINVHPDLVGSSLYLENEDSDVNGVPRVVPAITIDEVCRERKTQGPYLIKVDVQGAELDALQGALSILEDTEYIILETVLFQVFLNGSQCYDIIKFMKEQGFVVYEIFDPVYRLLDEAMSQIDIAFVKERGQFRKYHFYATKQQREMQDKKIISEIIKQ